MTNLRKTLLAFLGVVAGGALWLGRPTQPASAAQVTLAAPAVLVVRADSVQRSSDAIAQPQLIEQAQCALRTGDRLE